MRMKLVATAAAVAAALLAMARAEAQAVGGSYAVSGTNFDGSPYTGSAVITPSGPAAHNAACRIEWRTGGTQSSGFCMISGDSLAAAYRLGNSVGLVLYQLQPDGSLNGVRTLADKPGQGTERLAPVQ
ncbi:MAG: hypothetical protein ACM3JG_02455 [Thiohalocapsa sp.]